MNVVQLERLLRHLIMNPSCSRGPVLVPTRQDLFT